jgi:glyoxylase-like metal-dependent hydrolase (beta-lactamase superfamily II)
MKNYICITCGTQYPASAEAPAHCPICEDDRQYINAAGQQWTNLDDLRQEHTNTFIPIEPGLTGIRSEPSFAIGQQAYLIQTEAGNVLWDCISLIDDATIARIKALGGIQAIAISHPHMYSSMIEWSHAFDAPIYLHAENRPWIMRPDEAIRYWDDETQALLHGLTLVRCGGHFPGSTVLHWAGGVGGRGVLFTGDTMMVVSDRRYVSFMYSYPNLIPLNATAVRRIVAAVEPFAFERLYAAWDGKFVAENAKVAVQRSAERYIAHIQE